MALPELLAGAVAETAIQAAALPEVVEAAAVGELAVLRLEAPVEKAAQGEGEAGVAVRRSQLQQRLAPGATVALLIASS